MFGSHNNDAAAPAADATVVTPPSGTTLPSVSDGTSTASAGPSYDSNGFLTTASASTDVPAPVSVPAPTPPPADTPAPSEPEAEVPGAPQVVTSSDSPAASTMPAADTSDDAAPADTSGPTVGGPDADDLLDIKQQALQQLSPLVGHLDQTPEEKFRTTMMMIQAADDQSLIKDAYAAAQQITDEKTKAQALLDIVNEINYFNQNSAQK